MELVEGGVIIDWPALKRFWPIFGGSDWNLIFIGLKYL